MQVSQKQTILNHLRRGKAITALSALAVAGSLRLSERIREIEAMGYRIKRQMIKAGDKRVMLYWLPRAAR